jgi:hypothetical protein
MKEAHDAVCSILIFNEQKMTVGWLVDAETTGAKRWCS